MSFAIRPDGIMDPDGRYPNPLTGQPYSKQYFYHARRMKDGSPEGWTTYKPWLDRIEILKKIHNNNILLAIIPPGTGKTVVLPKLLLHYFGYQRPVICTTPRQATTSGAGEYAARCLDVPLFWTDDEGNDIKNPEIKNKREENRYDTGLRIVGYKHGAKNMSTKDTLLLFTTDGSLKQTILSGDATLSKVGGVIIDEAHERSVNIDIVIALLMDIIKIRPDFKVIIMSATIDENLFTDYFKRINLGHTYAVYKVPELKPLFKRELIKETKKIDQMKLIEIIYTKINEIILNPKLEVGDILAFVTSDAETKKVKKRIENNMRNYPVNNKPYPIAFSAQISDSDKSIATKKGALKTDVPPTPEAPQGFSRKVIIGTNAVESSVTFSDPMKYVIESGMAFEKTYDARNYCYITGKFYVSQASIEQRCGRTGRTCDGKCIQLYTPVEFDKFKKFTDPKILTEDFTKELLGIICLPMNGNLQKGLDFINRMIEDPKNYQIAISRAYNNLLNMGFLDSAGNITLLGYTCNQFNKFDIKIAKMVVGGYYLNCLDYTIALGAILQTVMGFDDIFFKPLDMDEDKELEKQYNDNIRRLKYDRGDHLTLLSLYVNWSTSANPEEYANQNKLEQRTLINIQKTHNDLIKEVEKLKFNIKNLNLFSIPSETLAFGGGGAIDNESMKYMFQNGGYKFDGEVDYEDDDYDEDEDNDILSLDSESDSDDDILEENKLNQLSKMPSKKDIENHIEKLLGGAEEDPKFKTRLTKESVQKLNDEINSETNIQNNSTNTNLFDITSEHVGGNSSNNSRTNGKYQNDKKTIKNLHQYLSANNIQHSTNKYNTNQHKYQDNNMRPNNQQHGMKTLKRGGGEKEKDKIKEAEKELQKKIQRNQNIMEIITLKELVPRIMVPPNTIVDRVMAALFYGYSNNIAAYNGSGKKYNVKFSPQKASIGKTVFDFNNLTPDWVIYHEFTMVRTMGRPDDAKLSIVSELRSNDFLQFLDINEIRKKL